jgi:hypothetical protein
MAASADCGTSLKFGRTAEAISCAAARVSAVFNIGDESRSGGMNAGRPVLVDVDAQADAVHLELQEGREDLGVFVQDGLKQLQKRLRLLFFAHCRSVLLATKRASVIVEEWTNQSSRPSHQRHP